MRVAVDLKRLSYPVVEKPDNVAHGSGSLFDLSKAPRGSSSPPVSYWNAGVTENP